MLIHVVPTYPWLIGALIVVLACLPVSLLNWIFTRKYTSKQIDSLTTIKLRAANKATCEKTLKGRAQLNQHHEKLSLMGSFLV